MKRRQAVLEESFGGYDVRYDVTTTNQQIVCCYIKMFRVGAGVCTQTCRNKYVLAHKSEGLTKVALLKHTE